MSSLRLSLGLFLLAASCGSGGDARDAGSLPDVVADRSRETSRAPADAAPDARPRDARREEDAPPAAFVPIAVPLAGCAAGSFLAEVRVGSQSFEVVVDTGSTTLAVAQAGCSSCGVSPEYAPGPTATDEHHTADSEYGGSGDAGASGWMGEIWSDQVELGGSSPAEATMKLVGIQSQSQFFYPFQCGSTNEPYEGIVGFAPAPDAIPGTQGYFDALVAGRAVPDVFAVELCDPGGTLWLGGYDAAATTASPTWVPYAPGMNSQSSYVVDMERVEIAGASITIPSGPYTDTIVDTGNNSFTLPPDSIAALGAAIWTSSGFRAAFGPDAGAGDGGGADAGAEFFENMDGSTGCATTSLSEAELAAMLPPTTLVFGAAGTSQITVAATESYLFSVGGGTWCSALYGLAPSADYPFPASLGAPVLRGAVTIFDRAHARIGFAPKKPCD